MTTRTKKALKTAAGIALMPAAGAALWATGATLGPALGKLKATFPLLAGAAAYLLLHSAGLLGNWDKGGSRRLYVTAHELTHALAAILSGVKVRKISVRGSDGYVITDSSNLFISLAPYFVPLYTLLAAAAYWAVRHFFPEVQLRHWFLGVAGFTLAFHLLHTAEILSGPVQSDLKKAGGALFSLPVVLILNCAGLGLALKLLFPELLSAGVYWRNFLRACATAYGGLWLGAEYVFNTAKMYLRL